MNIFESNKSFNLGNFKIMPFELFHDVTCHGFLINHPEMGNLLFATDTKQIPYKIPGLNHIMIECNYKQDIINHNADIGEIPLFHRNRVMHSHLDLDYVKGFLMDNDLRNVHNIVLLHLSGQNSNPDEMKKEIEQLTHKNVFIASKGLKIELNKEVF